MNKNKILLIIAILISSMTLGCAQGQTDLLDKPGNISKGRRFLKAGWNSGSIAIYNEDGTVEWELKCPDETSDAWYLADGSIVYSFSRRKDNTAGVILLDPDKNIKWQYTCLSGYDNHSCQPLNDGGFLLGETSPNGSWMVELDSKGKVRKRIKVMDSNKDYHHAFRQVRKTAENTYLGTVMSQNKAYEWDSAGKLIRSFPNGIFVAIRLPDGNTLVSTKPTKDNGYSYVIEYDKEGSVAWSFSQKDIDKMDLQVIMVCGIQRLENGNTVITNVDHGKPYGKGPIPKVFEVTRDKKVIWMHCDQTKYEMGNVQVIGDENIVLK